jgi:hypothetical protein
MHFKSITATAKMPRLFTKLPARANPLALFQFREEPGWVILLLFLALNAALGLLFAKSPFLATAHAGLVLLVGVWWVLDRPRPARAAYLSAYIMGNETLWRMSKAELPWDYGKFAIVTLLVLSLLRNHRLKLQPLPVLFFLLLLPALVLPLSSVDFTTLRQQISFNLSGPLVLAVSVWFFAQVALTAAQMQWLYLAFLGPALGIAAIALNGILSARDLVFTFGSNAQLSGGFGPNHVAAVLGFGAVCCFHWALQKQVSLLLRLLLWLLMLYFLVQSALTFSRGGVYMAILAILVAVFLLIRNPQARLKLFAAACVIVLAGYFVILPGLDSFTGGKFSKRFADTGTTGRDDIALGDLLVFLEHPVFGVGPGQTRYFRPQHLHYYYATAHTEFTRLLSEHGSFGIAAILVLLLMAFQHFRQARSVASQAFAASFLAWSFLFLFYNSTRLAIPSVVFGLSAAANWLPSRVKAVESTEQRPRYNSTAPKIVNAEIV